MRARHARPDRTGCSPVSFLAWLALGDPGNIGGAALTGRLTSRAIPACPASQLSRGSGRTNQHQRLVAADVPLATARRHVFPLAPTAPTESCGLLPPSLSGGPRASHFETPDLGPVTSVEAVFPKRATNATCYHADGTVALCLIGASLVIPSASGGLPSPSTGTHRMHLASSLETTNGAQPIERAYAGTVRRLTTCRPRA